MTKQCERAAEAAKVHLCGVASPRRSPLPLARHSETVAIADSQTSSHTYASAALSHQLHASTLTFPATLTDKPYASDSVSIHHAQS